MKNFNLDFLKFNENACFSLKIASKTYFVKCTLYSRPLVRNDHPIPEDK